MVISRKQTKQIRQAIEQTRAKGRRVEGELPPESKYRNEIITTEEGTFASRLEYGRWCDLCNLQRAGVIRGLRRQVTFSLDVNGVHVCDYIADAVYQMNGRTIVEDTKGVRTTVYKLKKKLMLAVRGITINEWPDPRTRRRKRKVKKSHASNSN